MSNNRYLVVVYPPKPAKRDSNVSSYTVAESPSVQWVTASSPQAAAANARVQPGGHALVVDDVDVTRFDRAEQAPLEERQVDGQPFDRAAVAG